MVLKREKERLLDENDYLKELAAHQKQTVQGAKIAALVHVSLTKSWSSIVISVVQRNVYKNYNPK